MATKKSKQQAEALAPPPAVILGDENPHTKPGMGTKASIYFMFSTLETMGWKVDETSESMIVTIPKEGPWILAIDRLTQRVYIEAEDKVLTGLEVRKMIDPANPNNPIPATLVPKPGEAYEITHLLVAADQP